MGGIPDAIPNEIPLGLIQIRTRNPAGIYQDKNMSYRDSGGICRILVGFIESLAW